MKEVFRIEGLMISMRSITALKLTLKDVAVLAYMYSFAASGNSEKTTVEGTDYFYVAYHKILTDLPLLDIEKRQIIRIIDKLRALKILTPLNTSVGRKKTKFSFNFRFVRDVKSVPEEPTALYLITPKAEVHETVIVQKKLKQNIEALPDEQIKTRLTFLVDKLPSQQVYSLNGTNVTTLQTLIALNNIFKRPPREQLSLFVDTFKNVDEHDATNNFTYTIGALFNASFEYSKKSTRPEERTYTKAELDALYDDLEEIDALLDN